MELIDRINNLEKKLKNNELEIVKLTEREKGLKEEKEKILSELKEFGVNESELKDKITTIENEAQSEVNKIEDTLK